jgi:hypothetical protein
VIADVCIPMFFAGPVHQTHPVNTNITPAHRRNTRWSLCGFFPNLAASDPRAMRTHPQTKHRCVEPHSSRDAPHPSYSLAHERNTHRSMRIARETCIREMVDPSIVRCACACGPTHKQREWEMIVLFLQNGPFSVGVGCQARLEGYLC